MVFLPLDNVDWAHEALENDVKAGAIILTELRASLKKKLEDSVGPYTLCFMSSSISKIYIDILQN